ncbi:MAG TPA: cytochrome c biogenesis protein ResB [Anaeromyxobacteraceae bacterium]|nr:cytochrome c biogenesis protein ResB [Anaeromyxobacteraceae bacterium]
MIRLLRSAGFARAVLVSLGGYVALGAWLPWARSGGPRAPGWAAFLWLDRPFSSPAFLAGCAALFASTLACTWGRRSRIAAALRGELPALAAALPERPGGDAREFLRSQGFRGDGPVLRRHAAALWGGWVFHVGLLVLVAAVVVQQALHDGGAFELTEGEWGNLARSGFGLARDRGPLAPRDPPDLEVGLVEFDPFLHRRGYAPDRASRLSLRPAGGAPVGAALDRARGVTVGGVTIYQAIPSGLALNLEIAGRGVQSVHLKTVGERSAAAAVLDPGGRPVRFALESEHAIDDRRGTGALAVRLEGGDGTVLVRPGTVFAFGGLPARLASVGRWSGFTWSRSPGMPGILAGFALVLAGALLLVFPAAVARLEAPGSGAAARVSGRGTEVLLRRWTAAPGEGQFRRGPGAGAE